MTSERGPLPGLRTAGLVAVGIGAVGSVFLLTLASHQRNSERLLLAIMAGWVLAPYIGLVLAAMMSTRWSLLTRKTLYGVMLLVALCSLAIYGHDVLSPRKAQAAFVWVIVPPASWVLMAIAVPIAALIERKYP